ARGRGGWRAAVAVALGLLFVIGGGLAAYQLLFKTANGDLVVVVEDDAEVRFKNGEVRIHGDDGKLRYTLKPSQKNKSLPPGQYRVEVAGVDGLALDVEKFEMKKNGRVVVHVKAVPAVAQKDRARTPAEVDRQAAEWVLSV